MGVNMFEKNWEAKFEAWSEKWYERHFRHSLKKVDRLLKKRLRDRSKFDNVKLKSTLATHVHKARADYPSYRQ